MDNDPLKKGTPQSLAQPILSVEPPPFTRQKYSNKNFLIGFSIAVLIILTYTASFIAHSKNLEADEQHRIAQKFTEAKNKCASDPIIITQTNAAPYGSDIFIGTTSSQPIYKDAIGYYCTPDEALESMKYRNVTVAIDGRSYSTSNYAAKDYYSSMSQKFYVPTTTISGHTIANKSVSKYSKSYSVRYSSIGAKSTSNSHKISFNCNFDDRGFFIEGTKIALDDQGNRISKVNTGVNEKFHYLINLPDTVCSLSGVVDLSQDNAVHYLQTLKVADIDTMLTYELN